MGDKKPELLDPLPNDGRRMDSSHQLFWPEKADTHVPTGSKANRKNLISELTVTSVQVHRLQGSILCAFSH